MAGVPTGTFSTVRLVAGAWIIMPLPTYMETWWMERWSRPDASKGRSPGLGHARSIGVPAPAWSSASRGRTIELA